MTWGWLADISSEQADGVLEDYGLTSPPLDEALVANLFEYFRTLGILDSKGRRKPAADELARAACARGWPTCG